MIDPPRLRESGSDASPELRELFVDAQKPEPLTPATDARVLAKVTALGALPAAPLAKAMPWLIAGGAIVLAGALALVTQSEKAPPAAGTPSPPQASAAPAPAPPEPAAPAPPDSPTSGETKRSVTASPARLAPAEAPSAAEDALAGEAKLLNQAHAVMATDARQALAIAGEHTKRYPRGQLAAERELIVVQALVKLGRTREAEARGRALRKSAPSSIYGERLDTILKAK